MMALTVENLNLNEEMIKESGGGDDKMVESSESDDEEMIEESGSDDDGDSESGSGDDDDGSNEGDDSDPFVVAAREDKKLIRALTFKPSKWPPEWEEDIGKSPQFLNGMITSFVHPMPLEDGPPIPDSDFKYRGPRVQNLHEKLKARIRSIRDSRGYDVDHSVSGRLLGDPFRKANLEDPHYKEFYAKAMKFVIRKINSHAKPYNKRYELVEIKKIVKALPHRSMLITFSVNEFSENMDMDVVPKIIQAMVYFERPRNLFVLREWRFKPEATSTSVETSSDGA